MPLPVVPIDLLDRVESGACVVFVGPGTSLPDPGTLGPPGPAMLAAELALRLDHLPADITLPWVAQLYKARPGGKQELRDYIVRRLNDERYQPSAVHARLLRLPAKTFVVTAYDVLLDRLARQQPSRLKVVLEDEDMSAQVERQFFRPYGTVELPASLRVAEDELEEIFSSQSPIGGMVDQLRVWSRTHALLFVGYYLGDAMFRRLFSHLRPWRDKDKAPAAYIVQLAPDASEVTHWQQRGLVAIDDEPDRFLARLEAELIQRRKVALPDPVPAPPRPSELGAVEQTQTDEVVKEVLNRMGIRGVVESGRQFRSAAYNFDFLRQLSAEHAPARSLGADSETPAPTGELAATANRAQILIQYGNAAWAERNYDQAQQYFEDALRHDPGFVDAYLSLHYLLTEKGQLKRALEMYQQAIAIGPEYALLPPQYEIQAVLAQTDLGVTYRVWDQENQQTLAITILRRMFTRDQDIDSIEHFGEMLSRLQHPRISRLVKVGYYRSRYFIARDYAEGSLLAQRLPNQPLPIAEVYALFDQVAEALEYAHAQGVAHLGLTPANILLTANGARLINFGQAHLALALRRAPGDSSGGRDYQPPEQRAGTVTHREQSDIYALGTIVYEMITGRLPGDVAFEAPSLANPQADEALDVFVAKARALDPAQRFPAVAQMRREMQRLAQINRPGGVYQTLRWGLGLASRLMDRLLTPAGGAALIAIFALALLAEMPGLEAYRPTSRVLPLLMFNIIPTGLLSYLFVREVARSTGIGSLIHSGKGLGAVMGLLMTMWNLSATKWGDTDCRQPPLNWIDGLPPYNYIPFLLVALMFTLLLALLIILPSLHGAGWITYRIWKRYTGGFYGMYLIWCAVVIVLSVARQPCGLISP